MQLLVSRELLSAIGGVIHCHGRSDSETESRQHGRPLTPPPFGKKQGHHDQHHQGGNTFFLPIRRCRRCRKDGAHRLAYALAFFNACACARRRMHRQAFAINKTGERPIITFAIWTRQAGFLYSFTLQGGAGMDGTQARVLKQGVHCCWHPCRALLCFLGSSKQIVVFRVSRHKAVNFLRASLNAAIAT